MKQELAKEMRELSELMEKQRREWVDAHNSLQIKKAADRNSYYMKKKLQQGTHEENPHKKHAPGKIGLNELHKVGPTHNKN